jgi:hypothetical protein
MKLKLVVVDLELSSLQRRIVGAAIVPAMLLGGAVVAYASVPHSWADGDVLLAEDLNANFAALDARIAELEGQATGALQAQVDAIEAGLAAGCGPKEAIASVVDGTAVCIPANDIVGITAEVVGGEGGTTTVACPSGYALVAAAVGTDQRTESGTNGWADGVVDCYVSKDGLLGASLGQYSAGSPQTRMTCYGTCVRG